MNTPITPIFIGYNRLEEWAEVVSLLDPVYALLVEEPGPVATHGYQVKRQVIVCAQPDPDDRIHYCRLHVGSLEFAGGAPLSDDHAQRNARAQKAWQIVRTWLKERAVSPSGKL